MNILREYIRELLREKRNTAGTFYHFSNEKFDEFSLSNASDSAIWGKGIYLSDDPDDLSGWGKEDRNRGFLYTVEIKSDQKNIIDMTQPIPPEIYERIEAHLERPLSDITKEDGIFPFNTLDRKSGSVANAMREMGFEVLKHPPPGSHKGSHYLVTEPSVIGVLEVQQQ